LFPGKNVRGRNGRDDNDDDDEMDAARDVVVVELKVANAATATGPLRRIVTPNMANIRKKVAVEKRLLSNKEKKKPMQQCV
jgi:hypothetical protein